MWRPQELDQENPGDRRIGGKIPCVCFKTAVYGPDAFGREQRKKDIVMISL